MDVETVRVILERTFEMPVAESDAQIVLNRLNEIAQAEEAAQHLNAGDKCPRCDGSGQVCNDGFVWVACHVCNGAGICA